MLKISKLSEIALGLMAIMMIVSRCNCDLDKEFNNFTSTPKSHVYQVTGSSIATVLRTQNNNSNCDPSSNFSARVRITVRTASVINGTVVADPNPYKEYDQDYTFEKDNSFNNPGAKMEIDVPSVGAYGILMEVELPDCSNCCNGANSTIHCSSDRTFTNGQWICKTGKPKVAFEKTFSSAERPDSRSNSTQVNFVVSENMLQVRKCYSCSSCTNPCN